MRAVVAGETWLAVGVQVRVAPVRRARSVAAQWASSFVAAARHDRVPAECGPGRRVWQTGRGWFCFEEGSPVEVGNLGNLTHVQCTRGTSGHKRAHITICNVKF